MIVSRKQLLFLWVLLLILFRPSILGERFNPIIYVLFVGLTLVIFLTDPTDRKSFIGKGSLSVLGVILVMGMYFLVQGMLLSSAKQTVLNSSIVILGVSICIAYVSRGNYIEMLLKHFVNIMFVMSLTVPVTAAIILLSGGDGGQVPVVANLDFLIPSYANIEQGADSSHLILFPYTIVWSRFNAFGYHLPRFIGIFREPGMTQIFIVTAFFLTYYLDLRRAKLKRFVLLFAAIATFSTAALVSIIAGYFMFWLFSKGRIPSPNRLGATIIGTAILIIVFANIPSIGFLNKVSSVSGEERSESFQRSVDMLASAPIFGLGYYEGFNRNSSGVVVSKQFLGIIGVAYQLGLVGLFLYFMSWTMGLYALGSIRTFAIYLPCLVTLLVSQPSYNDVFVFFLLLTDTRRLGLQDEGIASQMSEQLTG